jgi:hypothetical protein
MRILFGGISDTNVCGSKVDRHAASEQAAIDELERLEGESEGVGRLYFSSGCRLSPAP